MSLHPSYLILNLFLSRKQAQEMEILDQDQRFQNHYLLISSLNHQNDTFLNKYICANPKKTNSLSKNQINLLISISNSSIDKFSGICVKGTGVKLFSYSAPHLVLRERFLTSKNKKNHYKISFINWNIAWNVRRAIQTFHFIS